MIIRHYKLDENDALWTPGVKEALNFAIRVTGQKKPRVPFLYEEIVFHDTDKEQKVYYDLLPFQKVFRSPLEDCDLIVRFCGDKNVRFAEDYDYDSPSNGFCVKKFPNGFIMKPVFSSTAARKACCVSVTAPITYVSFCCAYQKNPRKLASTTVVIHRVLAHGVPLAIPFRELHSKKEIKTSKQLKPLLRFFQRRR